jgi:hypothetical protein
MSTKQAQATINSFEYRRDAGWSSELPRELNSTGTVVFAFGASALIDDTSPLAELRSAFPDSHLIGCSTAGEVLGPVVSDHSIAAAAIRFSHTRVASANAPVRTSGDSRLAGRHIAEQLLADGLRAVFVLSDGLNVNGSELVRGMNEVLPPQTIVTGGLAGDGSAFRRTWVLQNGEPRTHMISAIGLFGDNVEVGHASRGGWDTFGPERTVTLSDGNVLKELDGQPALELYKKYLGHRSAELPFSALLFPLRIASPEQPDIQLVRTVLAVDETAGTMTFAGDIPQGSTAQLMRANFDRIIAAAGESSVQARPQEVRQGNSPTLSIAISCVGRRLILGERIEEELEAAHDVLSPDDHQIGFYSYGELSPFASGRCELHNQTMTITTIRER